MNASPAADPAQPGPEPAADGVQAADQEPEAAEQKDTRALGREFSQRAAQPGGTGERLDAERDARSNFTGANVSADKVVGGNEYNYITVTAGQTRIRLVALTAEDHELDGVYVPPPGFNALETRVGTHSVLILRGGADTGKYALARHLLLRFALGGPVSRLHPETDLGALSAADLRPGGYMLADLEAPSASKLRGFDLDRLAAELKKAHKLIITVNEGVSFGDAGVDRYICDVRPSDLTAVLEAHLVRALKSPLRAKAILRDTAVKTLCEEQLRDGTPAAAVRLAQLLAEAGDPIAESVRARLSTGQGLDLEGWFSGLSDLDTQTLAIGISVLGGEPYELVSSAAEALKHRLEPANQPAQAPAPFGGSRSSRLRALHAHLVPSNMPTRHGGTAPGKVVRFQDRALAHQVLLHVWDEYDDVRSELLTWLRLCARNEVPTVRVRAAVATGILATRAFDHIRSTIILPWARSAPADLRDAAASALGVAADQPELRNAVLSLVGAWSSDDSAPRLQATAARAWRVQLNGLGRCTDAVTLLDKLGGVRNGEVVEAVCESIAEMLEFEDSRFAPDTLDLLLSWLKGRKPERRVAAHLAFLLAAADLVRDVPPEGIRPTLLDIAEQDRASARKIAELWSAALNSADLNKAAKDVLSEWARTVESGPASVAAFARLISAAATTTRTGRIIAIAAATWSHAPRAKAAVLAAIPS